MSWVCEDLWIELNCFYAGKEKYRAMCAKVLIAVGQVAVEGDYTKSRIAFLVSALSFSGELSREIGLDPSIMDCTQLTKR